MKYISKKTVAYVIIAFLLGFGTQYAIFNFGARFLTDRFVQEQDAIGWASYAASLQANNDFHQGSIRQYVLTKTDTVTAPISQGNNADGYEIWLWPYHQQIQKASAEAFVNTYNSKMKYLNSVQTTDMISDDGKTKP